MTYSSLARLGSLGRCLVIALAGTAACSELGHPSSIERCADLRTALATGAVHEGARYVGKTGFAFQSLAGATLTEADVDRCEQLERSLEELRTQGIPGVSLAYRSPRFQLGLARGLAEVRSRTDPRASSMASDKPLRLDSLVRAASIGKTYVGALATLLAIEGRVDLDNRDGGHALADYLPETRGKIEYAESITLRQLLNHTSGVPDYFGEAIGPAWLDLVFDRYHQGGGVAEKDALALVYGTPADFPPGSSGAYSNTGYVLAARVLSRVLGHPYQDEIARRFLRPLGLRDSYFEKHDRFDARRLSHGYRDASPLGENFSDWFAVDQGYGFANGGIVARVDELASFFRAVPGGKQLPRGIDAARFLETMRPSEAEGYGLGITRQNDCYFHAGSFSGYISLAAHCEGRDVTFALFTNSSEPEHEQATMTLGFELMTGL